MNLNLRTSINSKSGYKRLIKDILDFLPEVGIETTLIPLDGIQMELRNEFQRYISDKKIYNLKYPELVVIPPSDSVATSPLFRLNPHSNRVIFTMFESTQLPFEFVEELNKFDKVIVPNNWNAFHFKRQGVYVPISVIPLYVNTKLFFPESISSGIFNFGTANNDPRKRLSRTIKNFRKAFPEEKNVRLKVKLSPQEQSVDIIDRRIEIIRENFSDEQMRRWYNSIDVFVSSVSAEGWGMMQLESMACGKPIIAPNYAGLKEFLNDDNGFPLNSFEIPADGFWNVPGANWSDFNDSEMIESLKFCYNNKNVVLSKGRFSKETACNFSINRFVQTLQKELKNTFLE